MSFLVAKKLKRSRTRVRNNEVKWTWKKSCFCNTLWSDLIKIFIINSLNNQLTNMWTQCRHVRPTIIVANPPNKRPYKINLNKKLIKILDEVDMVHTALLNAIGIAKIPVPSELFRRWAKAPPVDVGLSCCRWSKGL